MTMKLPIFAFSFVLLAGIPGVAQTARKPARPDVIHKDSLGRVALSPQQKFVLDVVRSAVGLPQSDQQDRLRVLTAAADVVSPIQPAMSKKFAREGMRIEQELIVAGEKPAVSILNAGHVDCGSIQGFVENIPESKVAVAEQSLISAASMCPKEALTPVQRKVEVALDKGVLAPRALLAVIEQVGSKSPWAEQEFSKLFSSLPTSAEDYRNDAPNFAAMYARMAPDVSKDAAKAAGINFLNWIAKMKEGGPRNLALNIATDAMQGALGPSGYEDALAGDVVAQSVARTAGAPGEVEHPEEESVSVLQAMNNSSVDRTAELEKLSPSRRAREAAASGFATGTNGNSKMANRYFDMAYAALNDVWDNRANEKDASAVLEEVNEAAAQVDPTDALQRAQRLQDPSAQAIGMLAVARVVAGQDPEQSKDSKGKRQK
jgi:hypothetical protein